MAKSHKQTKPKAYIRLEMPGGLPWRKKPVSHAIIVEGESDFEMWANLVRDTLNEMGYNHPAWVVGFFLDVLNRFPEDIRRMFAIGIAEGYGTEVSTEEDGTIRIENVPMYSPLGSQDVVRPSGLVVPNTKPIGDLDRRIVLPGEAD